MNKIIYLLFFTLLMFSEPTFANGGIETAKKSNAKPLTAAEKKAAWEATPDGIHYKKWVASPAGKKVFAGTAKIRKAVKGFTNMEGVITSLTLPFGSRLGYGLMVRIQGEEYILTFGPEKKGKNALNKYIPFEQLHSLKVNDKITIKSHSVMHAPKYAYPIVSVEYAERGGKIIYERAPRMGGC